jgi:hypothetical protein
MEEATGDATQPGSQEPLRVRIYRLGGSNVRIEPAPAKRPWLPPAAYRCPPIVFANQLGYLLSLEGPLDLAWDGRPTPDGIQIDLHGQPLEARTDFGPGIASLFPGIVVKTPPGIGLLVKAVPNQPLGRLMLMEGFVETDWLEFTFNLSFKFLFPGRVQVPPRTPLCALLPYPTVLLKDAELSVVDHGAEHRRVEAYAERYLRNRVEAAQAAGRQGQEELFETLYLRGETLDGPRPRGTAHARSPWKG